MVFIYTTCANPEEAKSLGKLIIEKKMGACVDYWPIHSMYNVKGGLKELSETMMMITTFEPKLEEVNDFMSKHHSYSVPLVGGVDVHRINRAYKEWMMQAMA
jgi:periplasmic divalent cation tolerance protein